MLSPAHRARVDARLREMALDPDGAPLRRREPSGRVRYSAMVMIQDASAWAYRIDYVIDERMRAHLPAIVVLRGKALVRRN